MFSGLRVEPVLVRPGARALQSPLEPSLDLDEARVLHAWADATRSTLGIRTRAFWMTILELVFSGLELDRLSPELCLQGVSMHS